MREAPNSTSSTWRWMSTGSRESSKETAQAFWSRVCTEVTNRGTSSHSTIRNALQTQLPFRRTFVVGYRGEHSRRTWKSYSRRQEMKICCWQRKKSARETTEGSCSSICMRTGKWKSESVLDGLLLWSFKHTTKDDLLKIQVSSTLCSSASIPKSTSSRSRSLNS